MNNDPKMPLNHPNSSTLSNNESNPADIPFLVTHWLANYDTKEKTDESQQEIRRIRKATSDIASALASLGAFGTAFQVSLVSFLLLNSREQILTL